MNLLVLLLIGVTGYNVYETNQLKAEIAALQNKTGRHPVNSEQSAEGGDFNPSSLLEQARKHVGDAEAMLHAKNYDRARADLMASLQSVQRANTQAKAEGDKILAQLRAATQSLTEKTGAVPPTPRPKPTPHGNSARESGADAAQ